MTKVKSSVPRGFTRFYALYLIDEKPMTGKDIMEEAERRSEGEWRPSPGLIYPLLGRLLRDGLIEEMDDGKFTITTEGRASIEQRTMLQEQFERQFSLAMKLGLSMFAAGRLLAEESIDRITAVISMVKDMIAKSSTDLQKRFFVKYRSFLESELEKLGERQEEKTAGTERDEASG